MSEKDVVKKELKDVRKNYTRTPNILFESYSDLRPQEKWLYINLVYLCGSRGTRHLSLRYIHDRTGISLGALSGSKDPAKNDPGMIRSLHNAGLIHAEIKKKTKKDGKESDQAQYHITIVDLWQLNEHFFEERSENEHSDGESVQNMNSATMNCSENERERSENERERSENDTNIILHSKTTEQKESNAPDLSQLSLEELQAEIAKRQTSQQQPAQVSQEKPQQPAPQPTNQQNNNKLTYTPRGQHARGLWKKCTDRNPANTQANIEAFNELGDLAESDEDFTDVHTMMVNDPYYKEKGIRVTPVLMLSKWDGFIGRVDSFRKLAAKAGASKSVSGFRNQTFDPTPERHIEHTQRTYSLRRVSRPERPVRKSS